MDGKELKRVTLDLALLKKLRPLVFHLTARENVAQLRSCRRIYPAADLMRSAGRAALISQRRLRHEKLLIDGASVMVRDQAPLHEGTIAFEIGWHMSRFVAHINEHVFFWPGSNAGPIRAGRSHFERYRAESPVVIRMPLESLVQHNPDSEVLVCRHNSGAPRCSRAQRSPRGSTTYASLGSFTGVASDVVEIVFRGPVHLPAGAECSDSPDGCWRSLL